MTIIRRILPLFLIMICLAPPVTAGEKDPVLQERIERLEQENQSLHRQLRDVRRELAYVRSQDHAPGWAQVLGGVGVIFGLCGVGMMLSARKRAGGGEPSER